MTSSMLANTARTLTHALWRRQPRAPRVAHQAGSPGDPHGLESRGTEWVQRVATHPRMAHHHARRVIERHPRHVAQDARLGLAEEAMPARGRGLRAGEVEQRVHGAGAV